MTYPPDYEEPKVPYDWDDSLSGWLMYHRTVEEHMTTTRTPSPLGQRIAKELLSGYVMHGLANAEMIHSAALIVDYCIEEERLEREMEELMRAEVKEWERLGCGCEAEGRHGQRAYGPDHE